MSSSEPIPAALADLIGHIYEAAFEPAYWAEVLQHFAGLVNASSAAGFLHNFDAAAVGSTPGPASFAVTYGISDSFKTDYAQHFGAINPWAAREDALAPGRAVSSSMLYPDHLLPRTEFYGDYLRYQDIFYSLGGVVDRRSNLALKFAFMRSRSQGEYQPHELAMWQTLVPHVQRAARLHVRLRQHAGQMRDAEDVLAAAAGGVVVLDHKARVMRLNEEAQAALKGDLGLSVSGQGQVRVTPAPAQADLLAAVRAALDPSQALGAARVVLQSQGSAGGLRLEVLALPNPGREPDQQRCAILVTRLGSPLVDLNAALQRIYGLTPSEAALTDALVQGLSLAQVAEQRSVSIHTVRSQLKSVTSKVGAKRQADLVRIVLTGPAVRAAGGLGPP